MECDAASEIYRYEIDKKDIIVAVGQNWRSFAQENAGGSGSLPENLLGTLLWDHIAGEETRYLYGMILRELREQKRSASFCSGAIRPPGAVFSGYPSFPGRTAPSALKVRL